MIFVEFIEAICRVADKLNLDRVDIWSQDKAEDKTGINTSSSNVQNKNLDGFSQKVGKEPSGPENLTKSAT